MDPNRRSLFSRIFITPSEPRLRAGWRLLGNLLMMQFILLGAYLPLQAIRLPLSEFPGQELLSAQIAGLIGITGSIFLSRRWLDRRTFASLGVQADRRAVSDLVVGICISGVMLLALFLIQWLPGWLTFEPVSQTAEISPLVGLLAMGVVFTATGWQEELYFRGYLLQNLRDGINLPWAVALSTLAFSLAHFANPNASWMGLLGILLFGLFMVFCWMRTSRLWLPIGLHLGWNFFEGPVFGFPVSGLETFRLLQTRAAGPELITGGAFGPEAGLVLLPALAVGLLLVLAYTNSSRSSE